MARDRARWRQLTDRCAAQEELRPKVLAPKSDWAQRLLVSVYIYHGILLKDNNKKRDLALTTGNA